MSENCSHDCSNCSANCSSREGGKKPDFSAKANAHSNVKKVIGVVSGKGGVGKSMVTSLMAVLLRRQGLSIGILDADITGPSIPKSFGVHGQLMASEDGIYPAQSTTGVKLVSLNLMLNNETDPVVWRGPVIAGAVKQFWTDVMPPGTGDVPLTVFQSLPVDGIIIVTSPQELVGMIVEKAVRMAKMMNVPVLALVENMAYFQCDECGKKHYVFGKSHVDEIAQRNDIPLTAQMPINPALAAACDAGMIEMFDGDWLNGVADAIAKL